MAWLGAAFTKARGLFATLGGQLQSCRVLPGPTLAVRQWRHTCCCAAACPLPQPNTLHCLLPHHLLCAGCAVLQALASVRFLPSCRLT